MDTVPVVLAPTSTGRLDQLFDLAKILGPALLVVLSAYLAYTFARRQSREDRRVAFRTKQVSEFYSPMMGALNRIRSLSRLRAEVLDAADTAWRDVVDRVPAHNPEMSRHLEKEFAPFDKLIVYNNRQLSSELLPQYERMLSLLAEGFWLAEHSTRPHMTELTTFVELWRRHLDESLPKEVSERLSHSEAALEPLYRDLEETLDRLVEGLKAGEAT